MPRILFTVKSSLKEIRFLVDGKPLRTITEAPFTVSLRVPRTIDPEGIHTLEVILTDAYRNTVTQEVSFRFGERQVPQVEEGP